jgi:hypothetical protein
MHIIERTGYREEMDVHKRHYQAALPVEVVLEADPVLLHGQQLVNAVAFSPTVFL